MSPADRPDPRPDGGAGPDGPTLERVGSTRSGAWLPIGIVGIVAAAIVGVGWFGARSGATPAAVSPQPTASAGSPEAPASPTAVRSDRPVVFASAEFGYSVRAPDSPGEQIQFDDELTVSFVQSRISLAARGYGTITITVGPPDRGVPVGIPNVSAYGPDLQGLERVFVPAAEADVLQREERTVDGQPASVLDLRHRKAGRGAESSVALLAVAGSDFALFADGFDAGGPAATRSARHAALLDFLDRVAFSP